MEIKLQSEIILKLKPRGLLAYMATLLLGQGEYTTAQLAHMVRAQTETMREGLEELEMLCPELVSRANSTKWVVLMGDTALLLHGYEPSNRRKAFIDDLKRAWEYGNPGQKFTMSGADGNAIRQFLFKSHLTQAEWRQALNNRFHSEINKAQPPYKWLSRLVEYLQGPLDRFHMPMENGGGALGKALTIEQGNNASKQAAIAAHGVRP